MEYTKPIYDISIDEAMHLGVDEVAFVHDPAIEELWVAMANEEIKLSAEDDKMIVTGPALIPDKLIYRINKTGQEYYIRFSKETIQAIVKRYFTQNKQINFNLEHNKENDVQGVILESWIVKDPNMDQSVLYGFKNLIPGTWMISVKVEDEEFWRDYVKTGKVKGFSIEGAFAQSLAEAMAAQVALVEPHSGEHQDEFIPRCIAYHVDKENMDPDQAAAICYTKWEEKLRVGERISFDFDGTLNTRLGRELARRELRSGSTVYVISARSSKSGILPVTQALGIPDENVFATGSNLNKIEKIKELKITKHFDNNRNVKRMLPKVVVNFSLTEEEAELLIKSILMAEESYTDYPEAAVENAKTALRWAEENGWGSCGEQTGKIRANQIANKEPLTRDTIARVAAFERHRQNSTRELGDGCGRLMWLAWGGDEMIAWAQRKLEQIDKGTN